MRIYPKDRRIVNESTRFLTTFFGNRRIFRVRIILNAYDFLLYWMSIGIVSY